MASVPIESPGRTSPSLATSAATATPESTRRAREGSCRRRSNRVRAPISSTSLERPRSAARSACASRPAPRPRPPECFTLIDAGAVSGSFLVTDLPYLTTETEFDVTSDATSVTACVETIAYPLLVGSIAGDRAGP